MKRSVKPVEKMSERERTAALLVYMFACLVYDEEQHEDWYQWITSRMGKRPRSALSEVVLWALRFELEKPDHNWIEYVEYVRSFRT